MWSIKIDYVFHQNVMKLREIVVHMECYNLTKFHYILMKNIIVFYRSHLTDGPSVRSRWIRPKCIAFDDDIYMTLHFRSRILISARANVFFCPTFALSFEWAALSSSSISSSSRTFSLRWFSSSTTSNFVTRSYQYRSIYLLAVYSKAWKIKAC